MDESLTTAWLGPRCLGSQPAPLADSTRCKKPVPVLPQCQGWCSWALHAPQPWLPSPAAPFEREVTSRRKKLLKVPSFQQKAHPALSSETLRDFGNPAPVICGQGRDHSQGICKANPWSSHGCAQADRGCHLVQSKDTVASPRGGLRVTAGSRMPSWTGPEAKSCPHCGDENILPPTMTR